MNSMIDVRTAEKQKNKELGESARTIKRPPSGVLEQLTAFSSKHHFIIERPVGGAIDLEAAVGESGCSARAATGMIEHVDRGDRPIGERERSFYRLE